MADSNISHETEQRLRNLEAHAGIGEVDEETGDYSVKQFEPVQPAGRGTPDEDEEGA